MCFWLCQIDQYLHRKLGIIIIISSFIRKLEGKYPAELRLQTGGNNIAILQDHHFWYGSLKLQPIPGAYRHELDLWDQQFRTSRG